MKGRGKVLFSLATLMALLIGGGYYYSKLFFHHPEGTGPTGIRLREFPAKPDTNEIWIIAIGDSVTAGFGASPGKSYWDRLITNGGEEPGSKEKCLLRRFPNLLATNLALSGSTSLQHVKSQLPRVPRDGQRKAIVIMTTGGNDLIHNYGRTPPAEGAMYGATWEQSQPWIEGFRLRLEMMVNDLNTRFPKGVEIYLGTIYDPSDGTGAMKHTGLPAWPGCVKILAAYNEQIVGLGQRHKNVHVVDVHRAFLGHGLHAQHWWESHYDRADPYCWLAANIEDPNDRGYDAIYRLMWNTIADKPISAP